MDRRLFEDQVLNVWQKRDGVWYPTWNHYYDFSDEHLCAKCYREGVGIIDDVFCRGMPGGPWLERQNNPEDPRGPVGTYIRVGRYTVKTYKYDDGSFRATDGLVLLPEMLYERNVTWPYTLCDYKNISREDATFRSEGRFPIDVGVGTFRFVHVGGEIYAPEMRFHQSVSNYFDQTRGKWAMIYIFGFSLVRYATEN